MRIFGFFWSIMSLASSFFFFVLAFAPQWLDIQETAPVAGIVFLTVIAVALLIFGLYILWVAIFDPPM